MRQSGNPSHDIDDPYAQVAVYYNSNIDQFQDDIPLIRQLVETVGDPVLELGCGSGRILAGVTNLGMPLTGVDSSQVMLDRCSLRSALPGANLQLIRADMAATGLESSVFGLVLIGLSSLLHATTSDGQIDVLAESFRVLDPRGMLFIDLPNPLSGAFDPVDHHVLREGAWQADDGDQVVKFSARSVDRVSQQVSTEIWFDRTDAAGTVTRAATAFDVRFVYPSELILMLKIAGFVEWQLYGSYDLDPFSDSSQRLIVTAEKTART